MSLYKVASFFCRGWPIYTGVAVMQFPDLKNETEKIKSRCINCFYYILVCGTFQCKQQTNIDNVLKSNDKQTGTQQMEDKLPFITVLAIIVKACYFLCFR